MRYRAGTLLAVAAFAVAAEARAAVEAAGAPATVRLEIEAAYLADSAYDENRVVRGRFPVQRVFLPFKKVASRFLAYSDTRLVRGDDADATLRIEATGLALGMLYDYMEDLMRKRRLRFIGATIEGRVVFTTVAGVACSARFAGAISARTGIPVVAGPDYRESPNFAPFDKALAEPGSFVATLAAVIGAVYGSAPLAAARSDPDPAIARFAAAAFDRLASDAPQQARSEVPDVACTGD